ncbi:MULTISPECIES: response regulator [Sphingomonadaceae]|jgi:FixJ family two-component response regulator|uniref:Response regulator n=3 Tax=Sphingomonadaceae TaxID=41297 RepID=A0A081RIN0_SPHCR|nr:MULTISPECIES: response regulator [Sphingomonadaceae]MDE0877262.1 response regulator [Sphingomonas bacterium]HEX2020755.1 response regulator [Aurantimonas sp.]KEQ55053.1 Response regulator [Sphingobium chlorophenolicum]MBB3877093.1 FixJ family two-component response regulator [Sphingomonas aquatilis]MDK8187546.1 response regulator [Sphingomonas zeae]
MEQNPRALAVIVEDDQAVRRSLQLLLHWRGYDVRAYGTAQASVAGDDLASVGLLVADYQLPDGDGIGVLRALQRRGWCGRAVLVTGHPSAGLKDAALASGFNAVLEKPLRRHELLGALSR